MDRIVLFLASFGRSCMVYFEIQCSLAKSFTFVLFGAEKRRLPIASLTCTGPGRYQVYYFCSHNSKIVVSEVIVEHEWKNEDGENVMKVVGNVIEMQKKGSLPKGFALKGIQLVSGNNRSICTSDAPSGSALSELLSKLSPPTIHRVFGINRVF